MRSGFLSLSVAGLAPELEKTRSLTLMLTWLSHGSIMKRPKEQVTIVLRIILSCSLSVVRFCRVFL